VLLELDRQDLLPRIEQVMMKAVSIGKARSRRFASKSQEEIQAVKFAAEFYNRAQQPGKAAELLAYQS